MKNNIIKSACVAAVMLTGAVNADAAERHAQGGTLTVPIITQTFVDDFNPYSAAQADMVSGTMYEPLWATNVLQGENNWRLASGFSYADDLLSMTINLKSGLTWSDGETLDADDVVFSMNLGRDDAKLDATGQWSAGKIASVEALDATTVRINFTEIDGTIDWHIPRLTVVPKHIFKDVEDISTFANSNPVGSGPITEVKKVRDNQIEICRNPHYYKADQGLPYLDCIKFRQYSDNSQIQPALINDEIDWGSNFIADIDKTYVATNPDTHGYWYPANDLINVYLNTREKPFSDINFRQAFSMALDRPTIVDLAAYGYPTIEEHVTGIGEFYKAHFNDEVNAKYDYLAEYNPERAMALLDEAGYKDSDGDGFLENPDGSEINFDIQVVNGWTDWVQTVQMVTEYLAEIGIKANTRTVDWGVYDEALKDGTYQASISWSHIGVDPILVYRDYFYSAQRGLSWHTNHGIGSPEVDALIDEYTAISDSERRKAILAELMHYTAQNMPFVQVFSNPTWYQYNSTRIGGWATAENPIVQPVFYGADRKLILFEQLYATDMVAPDWQVKMLGDVVGDWVLAPEAGAFAVGPTLGDASWWANSAEDVTTRACLFDDVFSFDADGSFANQMGGETWVESWQGVAADSCGAPVAPHDSSNVATYSFDGDTAALTINGLGAHVGLPKVINGGELASPADAAASVTYVVTELTADAMTLDINFGPGYWRYKLVPAL